MHIERMVVLRLTRPFSGCSIHKAFSTRSDSLIKIRTCNITYTRFNLFKCVNVIFYLEIFLFIKELV